MILYLHLLLEDWSDTKNSESSALIKIEASVAAVSFQVKIF